MPTAVLTQAWCQHACLLQLIGEIAAVQPDAIAVRGKNEKLTYGELIGAANRFAHLLRKAEVGPETVVAVLMHPSAACLAALLGIWKVGAAYLALDTRCPPHRVAFMLKDADAQFAISEKRYAGALQTSEATHIFFADDPSLRNERSDAFDSDCSISPDSLAYVLYTSGSTGRPKGVEVCHGGLTNVVAGVADELRLRPGEVLLGHSSLGFDVANLEMYLPLVSGGSLYFAENHGACDSASLIRDLADSGATTMLGTCTLWRMLIDAGWVGKPDLRVISGGEILTAKLASLLTARSAGVWNQYGPTEGTICATTIRVEPAADKVTIGRPIANVAVHVLDDTLQPVAEGTVGELYIGGVGVARGYRNRPELSAASFLPDPFSSNPGGRLYKTGDLARWLADGRLEFLGRIDNQVKIHGYRIELEEIEAQIRQYPGVNAVVVLAVARGVSDQCLIAWIEAKQVIPSSLLRDFLKARLPLYMVPSQFRYLDSFPVTHNGKIDRSSLRAGYRSLPARVVKDSESENWVESRLRSIWEDLLSTKSISLKDNFFEVGGDSLLASLLITQIETNFGQKLSADILIECPTIEGLGARLKAGKQNLRPQILVPLRQGGHEAPFFIVHGLGGSVFSFRALTMSLGDNRPVYVVTLPSGRVNNIDEVDIKVFAAKCAEEIRRLYPLGPYHLGGHSFGALVAFEIATQLSGMDAPVGLLAFLDSDRNIAKANAPEQPNGQAQDRAAGLGLALRRGKLKLESLAEKGVAEVIRRRIGHIKLQRQVKLAKRVSRGELPERTFDAKELLVVAGSRYDPRRYLGNAVLFRAKEEARRDPDGALGWSDLIGGRLEVIDVPGKHMTILEPPNAIRLATELASRMNSARSVQATA